MVRRKTTIAPNRIKTDPAFARTRENATEFSRAAQAGKLLRATFYSAIYSASDNRVTSRLAGAMVGIIREDAINDRGYRKVLSENTPLLEGFEFNRHATLAATFAVPATTVIDRQMGRMVVSVPAFSPKKMISAPKGATHFRLKASGAAVDFDANTYSVATAESADLSLLNKMQEPIELTLTVPAGSELPLFLLFGIELIQVIKVGTVHPLNDGAFNAMAIVKVNHSATEHPLSGKAPAGENRRG